MSKYISIIFIATLLSISNFADAGWFDDKMQNLIQRRNVEKLEEYLTKLSDKMSKKLPMHIDKETQIIGVFGYVDEKRKGGVIRYTYKLVNLECKDLSPLDDTISYLKKQTLATSCSDVNNRKIVKVGVVFADYFYHDKNMVQCLSFSNNYAEEC
jgi:hypothetical protein